MSTTQASGASLNRYNRPMPPFFTAVNPESPAFVTKGVVASTLFGAAFGAASAYQVNAVPSHSSAQTGKMYFILSTAFFGFREYLVSPALLAMEATPGHARRFRELSEKQRGKLPEGPISIDEVKHQRVLDSVLAGALSFGTYSWYTRGASVVPRAALTAGLAAGGLQYLVNFIRVGRLHFLSRRSPTDPESEDESKMSLTQQIRFSGNNPTERIDHVPGEETLAGRVLGLMTYVAPLKKLTREESYQLLLDERKKLDRRLKQIEAEENRIFETVQARAKDRGEAVE